MSAQLVLKLKIQTLFFPLYLFIAVNTFSGLAKIVCPEITETLHNQNEKCMKRNNKRLSSTNTAEGPVYRILIHFKCPI